MSRFRVPCADSSFHVVNLGCAKNVVDGDSMAALLQDAGYHAVRKPARARFLVVNTCGFIGPAREESVRVLRELAAAKRPGQLLVAAGCLTQRDGRDVVRLVPGVDGVLGTRRWMDIVPVVGRLRSGRNPAPLFHLPDAPTVGRDEAGVLRASVAGGSAYLKIADGCRRPCAFCAIPAIKGPAVSRPLETIVAEARLLRDRGVRELILIAQDTTDYGHDLGLRDGLAQLVEALVAAVPDITWLRLLYAYPGHVTRRLIAAMAEHEQVVPYLDMPLQHAHPATLRRMRRPADVDWVRRTVAELRAALPEPALRTTFIVGYPGETDAEFSALLDFVREMRFDRVGAFRFSFERGTPSEPLGDPVPGHVKDERYEQLMELQQGISLAANQALMGRRLQVLVDGAGDGVSVARSYRDAPEIDGLVIVEGELPVGAMAAVEITGALAYDLTAAPAPAAVAPAALPSAAPPRPTLPDGRTP